MKPNIKLEEELGSPIQGKSYQATLNGSQYQSQIDKETHLKTTGRRSKTLTKSEKEQLQGKNEKVQENQKEVEEEYNPHKIPADWDKARRHAKARSVGVPILSKDQDYCPCCSYKVNRTLLDVGGELEQLSFLGSGFPLFYNFIKYCILLLSAFFVCKGAYGLYTNLQGNFCNGENLSVLGQSCTPTFIMQSSQANLLNDPSSLEFQSNLNLLLLIVISVILFYFRKSQREIDKYIDYKNTTPADFTLMIKNIPQGMKTDYEKELKTIFTHYAVPESDQQIVVSKVVLIYNIEEIIELEENLKLLVKKKQELLIRNKMNFEDAQIREIDEEIEREDAKIEDKKIEIKHDGLKFSGTAFVSFQTENMKDEVYNDNQHTWIDRFTAYKNQGKSESIKSHELSWDNQKLFIELAPEPNDIDWEFVHVKTCHKLKWRSFSWVISGGFIAFTFLLIYLLQTWIDSLQVWALTHPQDMDSFQTWKIAIISQSVSWIIVLFNKFIMGFSFHKIVDIEKISSKTKFNIQFAFKLSAALFINTAVVSYVIDILILRDVIGSGGFIQNETQVFILNALFPPFVWFVDPYSILKVYVRNRELKKAKLNQSVVTQQEANFLMEHTEYYQAKRYADIMKTVWFTFLYGNTIPVGILYSILGLSLYFWIDKYNVMRRRTVNESLAKEVSIEMIEMLELTLIYCGIGDITMSYLLFGTVQWQDIVLLVGGTILAFLPMQEINDWAFKITDHPETQSYDKAQYQFMTDYDRENPVTRKEAIEAWTKHKHLFPEE